MSYPHKFFRSVFQQENIEFIEEYSPDWLLGKRFDFFLMKEKCFVEVDGLLGHGKSVYPKSKKSVEQTLIVDKWKDECAVERNYKVYRVNADISDVCYLKENILKILKPISEFANVDWIICDKEGHKNLIKEVCDYYMKYKLISTTEVAKIFNSSGKTIRDYLKKGLKHNWCDYNIEAAKELNKQNLIDLNIERCSKPVSVYKEDVFIKQYVSLCELERRSLEDFGMIFNNSKMSMVANGKKRQYKGYIFKYTN